MRTIAEKISKVLKKSVALCGDLASWLVIVLVVIVVFDVGARYFFSYSTPALFESEWHLFGFIFLLGAGKTLQDDGHVRVDIFYNRFSKRRKDFVNLVGTLLLLIPFCAVGMVYGAKFAIESFRIAEASPDPGGLPARYIIKSAIPLGFLLLLLQGISNVVEIILRLSITTAKD